MKTVIVDGTVHAIGELVERGDFKKIDLVVKTDGEYPQIFAIEFVKEKIQDIDFLNVGEKVSISCNLRGREWTSQEGVTKYFQTLQAWKIEK